MLKQCLIEVLYLLWPLICWVHVRRTEAEQCAVWCFLRCELSVCGGEGHRVLLSIMSALGWVGGVWLSATSLLFINSAWFITAFIILEKQFKVYGQPCPYISLTSEEADIKKAQGKGLGKYEYQRKAHIQFRAVSTHVCEDEGQGKHQLGQSCLPSQWQCCQGCPQELTAPHTTVFVQGCLA